MLNVHEFKAQDLQRLSPDALAEVAAKLLLHIAEQSKLITSQAQAIKFRDVTESTLAIWTSETH